MRWLRPNKWRLYESTELTFVGVCFDAEAVLYAADPRPAVTGPGHRAMTYAVAAFDASRPVATVDPATVRLSAETVTTPVSPLTGVLVTCTDRKTPDIRFRCRYQPERERERETIGYDRRV